MAIEFTLTPTGNPDRTTINSVKDGGAAIPIAELRTSSNGTVLDGIHFPGIGSTGYIITRDGDPTGLGPSHLQILP